MASSDMHLGLISLVGIVDITYPRRSHDATQKIQCHNYVPIIDSYNGVKVSAGAFLDIFQPLRRVLGLQGRYDLVETS